MLVALGIAIGIDIETGRDKETLINSAFPAGQEAPPFSVAPSN
jgi:hypothetical protein